MAPKEGLRQCPSTRSGKSGGGGEAQGSEEAGTPSAAPPHSRRLILDPQCLACLSHSEEGWSRSEKVKAKPSFKPVPFLRERKTQCSSVHQ